MLLKQVQVFALGLHMLSLGHLFYFYLVVPFCVPCFCSDYVGFVLFCELLCILLKQFH